MTAHVIGTLLTRWMRWREGSPLEGQPALQQVSTLQQLLFRARDTAFGRAHHFSALLQVPPDELPLAFQQAVPIFTYEQIFTQWWHRILQGEPNVAWPEPIRYMANTSGTTLGSSKYVPVSPSMIRSTQRKSRQFMGQLATMGLPPDTLGRSVLSIGAPSVFKQEGGILTGMFSGIVFGQTPRWIRPMFKPGPRAYDLEWPEKVAFIAQNAKKWDLGAMYGFPVWMTPLLEEIVAYNKVRTIHDIWPNLRAYSYAGMKIDPYWPRLAPILGLEQQEVTEKDPIALLETYVASEGYFAMQTRQQRGTMRLLTNHEIYFEFIPFTTANFDDWGQPRKGCPVHQWTDLSVGTEYALLVSNNSGAWRYLIGDTIVFESLEPPEIRFAGRTAHFLNECQERLSVGNLEMAMVQVAERLGFRFNDFTVIPQHRNGQTVHIWCIASESVPKNLSLELERTLRQLNDDYDCARSKNALLAPEIQCLNPGTFQQWLLWRGKADGQSKVPRVMKGKQAEDFLNYLGL
jgi:GH3 auxin-responsive promoter